jgi:hypothetical protein
VHPSLGEYRLLVVSTGLMIFGGLVDNLIMGVAAANKGANIC